MKQTPVEGGVMWENDTAIPQGLYTGGQWVIIQPGKTYFAATPPEASKTDLAAVAAYAADAYKKE
jgi:hypothetical protein